MSRYAVKLVPRAAAQARLVDIWWRENRPAAPRLFSSELAAELERLSLVPYVGAAYDAAPMKGVRRRRLRSCGYQLYYTVDAELSRVVVRAIWHMRRGVGPDLQ